MSQSSKMNSYQQNKLQAMGLSNRQNSQEMTMQMKNKVSTSQEQVDQKNSNEYIEDSENKLTSQQKQSNNDQKQSDFQYLQ